MELSGVLSAASRRVIGAVGVAAFLSASVALAARESPAPVMQDQAAQADAFKFNTPGRVFILWEIKPDQVSNFTLAWRTIKDELRKMGDPSLTQLADSINILQVSTPAGAQSAVFLFDLNPVSTTHTYNPVTLLYETLKEDAAKPGVGLTYERSTEIFELIKGAYTSITPWPVTEIR